MNKNINLKEIWKGVIYQGEDYSNRLEISNLGNIRNSKTKHVYKTCVNKSTGYKQVVVSLGSRENKKVFKIHRCVAESFIFNLYNLPAINHKDGNKLNNYVKNLEWVTYSDNTKHAIQNGLFNIDVLIDTSINNRKLSKENIKYIKDKYISRNKEFGARALSRKFNVNHKTILKVINDKTYRNVI